MNIYYNLIQKKMIQFNHLNNNGKNLAKQMNKNLGMKLKGMFSKP